MSFLCFDEILRKKREKREQQEEEERRLAEEAERNKGPEQTIEEMWAEQEEEHKKIEFEQQLRLRGMTAPPVNAAPAAAPAPDVINFFKKKGMGNALLGANESPEDDSTIPEEVVNAADALADFHAEQDRSLAMSLTLTLSSKP